MSDTYPGTLKCPHCGDENNLGDHGTCAQTRRDELAALMRECSNAAPLGSFKWEQMADAVIAAGWVHTRALTEQGSATFDTYDCDTCGAEVIDCRWTAR